MPVRVLILTFTDEGGAGNANVNFAIGLKEVGYEVQVIVGRKKSSYDFVSEPQPRNLSVIEKVGKKVSRVAAKLISKVTGRIKFNPDTDTDPQYCFFNFDESASVITAEDIFQQVTHPPDIVVGAWLSYFMNYKTLGEIGKKYNARTYLLMNDMAMLTGGCHYAWSCEGYQKDCADCPAILNARFRDRAKENLALRKISVAEYGLEIIAGSKNTLQQCLVSTLFRDQRSFKLYNGLLDFNIFNGRRRAIAKEEMGLASDTKVILCAANNFKDPRKGFEKFKEAIRYFDNLLTERPLPFKFTLLLLGHSGDIGVRFENIDTKYRGVTKYKTDLALIYRASDLYISPSVEDSGPAMVIEALACGTPVIGFELGFVEDFVVDGVNGYKIQKYDTKAMSEKMYDLFASDRSDWAGHAIKSVQAVFSKDQLVDFFN